MADSDALTISWTRAQADRQRSMFQNVLGVIMLVEAFAAIVVFACPVWSASLTAWPAPDAALWVRIVALMWIVINLFQLPGLLNPVYRRSPILVGILTRVLLAIMAFGLGGFGWAVALVELVAAAAIAVFYGRLFRAELLCRP